MKNRILYFSATLTILFTLIAGIAKGQARDWVGGAGDWNVPGNWNPAGVPAATDDVTIGAGDDITVPAGFAAVSKSVTLSGGGDITIAATGSLEINGSTANGINMAGSGTSMTNLGILKIGNTTAISLSGILMGSGSVFSNGGSGSIEVDRITNNLAIWLLGANTQFDNSGIIKMGSLGTIKNWGIGLGTSASFNNNAGASIEINNTVQNGGIYMEVNTAFSNAGTIKIGNTAHIEIYGITVKSGSSFTNEASGVIEIDRVTGLVAYDLAVIRTEGAGTLFSNQGTLKIGSNSACSNHGISVQSGSVFTNNSAIPIEINNISNGGSIYAIGNGSTFTNAGTIKVGNLASVTSGMGVGSDGSFVNTAGATIELNRITATSALTGSLNGTFTNAGIITIGTISNSIYKSGIEFNESTFTNEATGAIEINYTFTGAGIQFQASSGKTFTNSGSIKIGNLGPIKFTGVDVAGNGLFANGATFLNNAGATLEVNNVTDNFGILVLNSGASGQGFINAGNLKIGNISPVKKDGINLYKGRFTNESTGTLEINRITSGFSIYGGDGSSAFAHFTNAGMIKIGNLAPVWSGIYMEYATTFTNDAGASIEINNIPAFGNALSMGGNITSPSTFVNNGTIKVGNLSAVHEGINLGGNSTIGATGSMEINNTSTTALNTRALAVGGTCTNSGSIKIGNLSNVSPYGFILGGNFTNTSGASVEIDRIPNNGIGNSALSIGSTGVFSNAGILKLGTLSSVRVGIHNNTGFGTAVVNNTGTITFGDILLQGITSNVAVTNNAGGLIQTPAGGKLSNSGTLVNNAGATILNGGTLTSFNTFTNNGIMTNNGTLTNNNVLNNNSGALLTNNGTLTNSSGATLTDNGTLKNNSLPFTNSGTLSVNGILELNTSPAVLPGGTFNWNSGGTVKIGSSGVMTMTSLLTVASGRFLSIEPSGLLTVTNTGQLANNGTVFVSGTLTNNGTLTNSVSSSLQVYATGLLTNNKTLNNISGGILTNAGTLNNNSGGIATNNGTFNNNSGGVWNNNSGGDMTNNGTLNNNSGGMMTNKAGATLTSYSTLLNNGAFTNLGTMATNAGIVTNNGTLTNDGTLTDKTIINNNSGGILLVNGTMTLISGAIIHSYGMLTINNGGVITNTSGTLYNYSSGILTNNTGGTLTNNSLLHNYGGTLNNSGALNNNNTLNSNNGSVLNNNSGAALTNNSGSTLTNDNALNNNSGATLTNKTGAALNSSGTIANHGTFNNSGVMTYYLLNNNAGALTNSSGATLTSFGTLTNYTGAILSNVGTLNNYILINNSILTNDGTLTNNSSSTVTNNDGGTLTNNGMLIFNTNSYLNNENGGILTNNNTGTLTNNWAIINHGTLTNHGTLNSNFSLYNDGALTNTGSATLDNNGGDISNNGTVTNDGFFQGTGSFLNAGIYQGGGVFSGNLFDNPAAGTIAPGNSPGCLTFTDGLSNIGTISIELSGTTNCSGYDQINVFGTATLDGTLTATLINGYTGTPGDVLPILGASLVSGTFATVDLPSGWSVDYSNPTAVRLVFGVLPVELTDFTARLVDSSVHLEWHTATEQNNRGFYVERSTEGQHWTQLGFVQGNGSSNQPHEYAFTDEKPLPGTNYYRLLQVDFDGRGTFSSVVPVTLENRPGRLSIYPNPVAAGAECLITYPFSDDEATASLRILDATGRQVAVSADAKQLSTTDLKPGVYWLEIRSDLGYSIGKLVVQ